MGRSPQARGLRSCLNLIRTSGLRLRRASRTPTRIHNPIRSRNGTTRSGSVGWAAARKAFGEGSTWAVRAREAGTSTRAKAAAARSRRAT